METKGYISDLSTDERVLMAVIRAAEGMKRSVTSIFRRYGLSFPQYNVLRVLEASAGGQNNIRGVSTIMLVPHANMTGIAKRMERDGLLVRKSDPRDERVTVLEITPKGQSMLKLIERDKDKSLDILLSEFSEAEKRDFLAQTRKLLQAIKGLT